MDNTKKQLHYLIIILLTTLDIIFLAYITFYPSSPELRYSGVVFDLIVCIILWTEFVYSYMNADDKKQYLKENSLSILGMLPLDFVFLRALRLIKLIQFIKLFVLARETRGNIAKFLRHTFLDKIILIAVIFIFILTVLIRIIDSNMNNIETALWYIIVSMTSTGYGDIVPATTTGRIIGIFSMLGGILIFAAITAVISSLYVSKIAKDNHESLESKIDDLTSEIERLNKKIDELNNEE